MKRTLTTALALALAACAQDGAEEVGSVGLAVTTVGGDGATYRLTPGARVSLSTTNPSGTPNYDVGLDGDGAVVTVRVVPGTYIATLYLDNNFNQTEWALMRTVNGVTDTVNGQLETQQPVTLVVSGGQTSNLVFEFAITTGKIVFGRGNLNIGIGANQATNYTASESGSGNIAGMPTFSGPYATGLQALLPGAGVQGLQIAISGHNIGPWIDAGGTIDPDGLNEAVCAPFQIDSLTGGGHPGLVALVQEANHGNAPSFLFGHSNICVIDDGTTGHIRLRATREGTADTAAFQTAFAPNNPPAMFHIQVLGDLPTRVYNATTGEFDSDALLGMQTLNMQLRLQVRDDTDGTVFWYAANAPGTETFSFSAH